MYKNEVVSALNFQNGQLNLKAYRYTADFTDTAWAWEYLRRDPGYRARANHQAANAEDWSLLRFEDPELDARHADVFWRPDTCKHVLPLIADAKREGGQRVSLETLKCRVIVHADGEHRHVLFAEAGRALQIQITGTGQVENAPLLTLALAPPHLRTARHPAFLRLDGARAGRGGANPPGATFLQIGQGQVTNVIHPLTFKPEYIEAFELGTKNSLLDNAVTLNGDVFYYDFRIAEFRPKDSRDPIHCAAPSPIGAAEAGKRQSFAPHSAEIETPAATPLAQIHCHGNAVLGLRKGSSSMGPLCLSIRGRWSRFAAAKFQRFRAIFSSRVAT